jgi:hypothetical protein
MLPGITSISWQLQLLNGLMDLDQIGHILRTCEKWRFKWVIDNNPFR